MTTFTNVIAQVESLYVGYFGRAGDPSGEQYWVNQLNLHTVTLAQIAASFSVQPEALAKYPYLQSPSTGNPHDFITAVYNQLFGHGPDAAGEAFWTAQLAAAQGSAAAIGSMILNIISGATGTDNTVVTNRVTVAADFTAQATNKGLPWTTTFANQSAAELTTVNDTAASVTAAIAATTTFFANQFQTLNLTQNIDTPPAFATDGTGVIFNAPPVVTALGIAVNTLNAGDNLQDSKADGTLNFLTANLTIGANAPFAQNVTMNGIKIANITGGGLTSGVGTGLTGFAGNITGLQVENSVNSNSPIQIGQASQGLNTLLTDINISGYNGQISTVGSFGGANTVVIANAAADLTKTINIGLKGVNLGTTNPATGGAFQLTIANDSVVGGTAANPNKTYGTWAITTANTANLELTQDINGISPAVGGAGGSGVGAATGLTLAGAGDIAVGASAAGDWRLLKTIDSSKETGKVVITGNTSFAGTSNAFASAANPNWLFGSVAGLLALPAGATSALTTATLGSGLTILDVSALSAAGVKGLTTAAGAGVTVNAANEIIVKDSVATTLSTDTFKNISGFSVLGIGGNAAGNADGAGGTIDMKNLTPSGFNKIIYQTLAGAPVVINNVTTTLTVDTEDNGNGFGLTVGAVGPNAGLSDIFNLSIGNPIQKSVGVIGNVLMTGEEQVNIASVGGVTPAFPPSGPDGNSTGTFHLAPTIALEQVTISGDTNIYVGFTGGSNGSIFAENAAHTALLTNQLAVTITNTATTIFEENLVGGLGANTSTNALILDASAAGSLIMRGGDANFGASALTGQIAPIAAATGDTITGAATPNQNGNILIGSLGNDILKGAVTESTAVSDSFATNGGADSITLAIGNGIDHIALFFARSNGGEVGGATLTHVGGQQIVVAGDFAQPGYWGNGTTATPNQPFVTFADGTGTSADMSTVANFKPGSAAALGDVLDFSIGAWGTGGIFPAELGLRASDNTVFGAGDATFTNDVSAGGAVVTNGSIIKMSGSPFADAAALANSLSGVGTGITLGAFIPGGLFGTDVHMLFAYQDLTGATRIADVDFHNVGAAQINTGFIDDVTASDMVQLTGVTLNTLNVHNLHFVT